MTYCVQTWMVSFGAESPKSTDLLSSERSVLRLGRSLSRKRKFEDMGIDGSVTGTPGLELTQAYAMEVFERFKSALPNPQLIDDWDSDHIRIMMEMMLRLKSGRMLGLPRLLLGCTFPLTPRVSQR